MNLVDPKCLLVPELGGLTCLLKLLTNYFKVEVGHKLLDHFRIVANPQLLISASKLVITENEGITKLVRLANIFHLLPSAANIFLENLVNLIVQTESRMDFSGKTPFSEPLTRYLNRYPTEGIDFFFRHLALDSHLRTLRSILQAKLAPNFQRELASQALSLVAARSFLDNRKRVSSTPSLNCNIRKPRPAIRAKHPDVLATSSRIDLVFEIVDIYTRNLGMDLVRTTRFLYKHVALSNDVLFQRNILMRFLT
ncbi:hypothetical protein DFH06DRAFT_1337874 [Mycena polygramma]|nr:hypothetical protein DFH06DRAFT_1337874 [Mycena polygramma]